MAGNLVDNACKWASSRVFIEVVVLLEAQAATAAEFELTYHVAGASWRPLYDLVLDGEKLTVSYLAEITQRTGEDWPEVTLVLSTTRQGLSQTLPELRPWYIGRPQPPRPAPMARSAASASMSAPGGAGMDGAFGEEGPVRAMAFAAARPEAKVLAATPGQSESGAGLVYTVARPLAVPSDGGPHKTLVAKSEADASLDYLTQIEARLPTLGYR